MLTIISKGSFQCEIFNAASNKEISIQEVAFAFEKNYPGNRSVSFSGEVKKGDPVNWHADISKLQVLGFEPKILFEDGVKNYINWFLAQ